MNAADEFTAADADQVFLRRLLIEVGCCSMTICGFTEQAPSAGVSVRLWTAP
jgi:hypothetical protein